MPACLDQRQWEGEQKWGNLESPQRREKNPVDETENAYCKARVVREPDRDKNGSHQAMGTGPRTEWVSNSHSCSTGCLVSCSVCLGGGTRGIAGNAQAAFLPATQQQACTGFTQSSLAPPPWQRLHSAQPHTQAPALAEAAPDPASYPGPPTSKTVHGDWE